MGAFQVCHSLGFILGFFHGLWKCVASAYHAWHAVKSDKLVSTPRALEFYYLAHVHIAAKN